MSNDIPVEANESGTSSTTITTDLFKRHIQAILEDSLGIKVSKQVAWELFKDIVNGSYEFTLQLPSKEDSPGKRLPLSGIGCFEILATRPRRSKAGLDKEGNPIPGAEPWPFVPRPRFRPSSRIVHVVENFYNLADHPVEKLSSGLFIKDRLSGRSLDETIRNASKLGQEPADS